jgi:hypothetical protein
MPDKYVSLGGDDDLNDGNSESYPYQTINKALDNVDGAFTIYLANGVYRPWQSLEFHDNGVTIQPLNMPSGSARGRFWGTDPFYHWAIIDGANLPAGAYNIFVIWQKNNVTIDGLEIRNGPYRGMAITGDNVTVKNSYVHHMQRHAGFAYECNDLILENIEMGPNGFSGTWHNFYPSGCQRTIARFCYIHDGTQAGLHINAEEANISRGNIIDSNIFGSGGNNRSNFMSTHDSFLINNLFVNHFWDCNNNPGYGEAGSDNHVIANNTFIQTVRSYALRLFGANTVSDPRYCCADNNKVFNNILLTTNGANAIIDDGTGNNLSNNYAATYSAAELAAMFVDAANNDYHILGSSPARGAGLSTYLGQGAPAYDFEGELRGDPPDLGFDEYLLSARVTSTRLLLTQAVSGFAAGEGTALMKLRERRPGTIKINEKISR